jgi:hypothetical protein
MIICIQYRHDGHDLCVPYTKFKKRATLSLILYPHVSYSKLTTSATVHKTGNTNIQIQQKLQQTIYHSVIIIVMILNAIIMKYFSMVYLML